MHITMMATLRQNGYEFRDGSWRRGNFAYAGFKTDEEMIEHAYQHYLSLKNGTHF